MNHVKSLISENSINFLGVSETWLTASVGDSFINIPGYHLLRCDSPSQRKKHGVAAYICNMCKYEVVDCSLENILIVYLFEYGIFVITVYRPPSNSEMTDSNLINFLEQYCQNKEVILQGDFNLPTLRWDLPDLFSSPISGHDLQFYEMFISVGFDQLVNEATNHPSGKVIDLCLVTHAYRVGQCSVLAPLPSCTHSPILIDYVFQSLPSSVTPAGLPKRIWTKGKYNLIASCLSRIDWEAELLALPADIQYSKFLDIVIPFINDFVPLADSPTVMKMSWTKNPQDNLLEHVINPGTCTREPGKMKVDIMKVL